MADTFKTGYTAFEKAMKLYNEHGGGNMKQKGIFKTTRKEKIKRSIQ